LAGGAITSSVDRQFTRARVLDLRPFELGRDARRTGGRLMEYTAIAFAILGCIVGATFRLRFLLGVVALVLAISIVLSLSHRFGAWDRVLIIVVPQAILQVSYLLGLVGRGIFSVVRRKLTSLSGAEAEHLRHPQDG
jgi:hypothetical protein